MAERVKISIHPSSTKGDWLDIEDMAQQLLDFFSLLEKVNKNLKYDNSLEWKLVSASTNSPLALEAEAYSREPNQIPDRQAVQVKKETSNVFNDIIEKSYLPDQIEPYEKKLRNIFDRTNNGIGTTHIDFCNKGIKPVNITNKTAYRALNALDKIALEKKEKETDYTHTAFGFVEGRIAGLGQHYNSPSFLINERLSGHQIRCVVPTDIAEKLGQKHNFHEVWKNKFVLVQGALSYNKEGVLEKLMWITLS